MLPLARIAALFLFALNILPSDASSWGRDGHDLVLARALSLLPESERDIYIAGRRELERWMAEPDKHHRLPGESSRHWLDVEKLEPGYLSLLADAAQRECGKERCADEHLREISLRIDTAFFAADPPPWSDERARVLWDSIPSNLREFEESMGQFAVIIGSAVYQPATYAAALRNARIAGENRTAAKFAGLLAHYAADLFGPFHLTVEYRGQYSGNLYFRHDERGDVHARFETGFIRANKRELEKALMEVPPELAPLDPQYITAEAISGAKAAYSLIPDLLSADRAACDRADPRRKWKSYLREVSPVFGEIASRQLANASEFIARLLLSALPASNYSPEDLSGNME